jgi:hypothetical protein
MQRKGAVFMRYSYIKDFKKCSTEEPVGVSRYLIFDDVLEIDESFPSKRVFLERRGVRALQMVPKSRIQFVGGVLVAPDFPQHYAMRVVGPFRSVVPALVRQKRIGRPVFLPGAQWLHRRVVVRGPKPSAFGAVYRMDLAPTNCLNEMPRGGLMFVIRRRRNGHPKLREHPRAPL